MTPACRGTHMGRSMGCHQSSKWVAAHTGWRGKTARWYISPHCTYSNRAMKWRCCAGIIMKTVKLHGRWQSMINAAKKVAQQRKQPRHTGSCDKMRGCNVSLPSQTTQHATTQILLQTKQKGTVTMIGTGRQQKQPMRQSFCDEKEKSQNTTEEKNALEDWRHQYHGN